MDETKDIISRLRQVFEVSNNKELSDKMGINYHTLNVWINRSSIPYNKLHDIIQNENISFDWIVTGRGTKYIKDEFCSDAITELDKIIDSDSKMYKYEKEVTNIEDELIESLRSLSQDKQEYYFHKIKADAIEHKLRNN